jgi:hypothetical protein
LGQLDVESFVRYRTFPAFFEAAFRPGDEGGIPQLTFFSTLEKGSDVHPQITSNKNYHDDDADDVEDVHCPIPDCFKTTA